MLKADVVCQPSELDEAVANIVLSCGCPKHSKSTPGEPASAAQPTSIVAIIVPFREQHDQDRRSQLTAFMQCMATFLPSENETRRYAIVVVEQAPDGRPFNRGQLLNIGFREAQRYLSPGALKSIILHDVDLLPSEGLRPWYRMPPALGYPIHLAAPSTWAKYAESAEYAARFFGGVTALHPADFERANGFPNDYWGWGMEDDQPRLRVDASGGLKRVVRPPFGVGVYDDLDPIRMNQRERMQSEPHAYVQDARGFESTVVRRFNPKMWDGKSHQRLDGAWRDANGLIGLKYEALRRDERQLAGSVVSVQVLAKLQSGFDDEFVERALRALQS